VKYCIRASERLRDEILSWMMEIRIKKSLNK